jgi:hypothetical protein
MAEDVSGVDFEKSLKKQMRKKYGRDLTDRIITVIQDCINRIGNDREQVEQCVNQALSQEIQEGKITEENVKNITLLMGHWHTVG